MKKNEKGKLKLALHRETLVRLEEEGLDNILGNATYTASNPCCPPTRPLTHCC